MAEINLTNGPVFVDVSTGQQFPVHDFNQTLLVQPAAKSIIIEVQPLPASQGGPSGVDAGQAVREGENLTPELQVIPSSSEPTTATQATSDSTETCVTIQKRRIRCPECQRYTAETEEKMLRHIRKVHRGENPFQCLMCEYTTYNKVLFEEHVRIHQGIKPYKCTQCPYRSVSKKNTKKHELIHRPDNPLKCNHCEFIARHPRALECHVKSHARDAKEKSVSRTCPDCPFEYTKQVQLRNHKKNNRWCEECSFKACTRKILTTHMVNVHRKMKSVPKKRVIPKLFQCGLCAWGSSNKVKILLHLIHHPNQKVDEDVIDIHILREYGIME